MIVKAETNKQEFSFRHFCLILPFYLRWAYQCSHPLNSEYQKIIYGVFLELILREMSDVTGYLIP